MSSDTDAQWKRLLTGTPRRLHLGTEVEEEAANHFNGYNGKTVLTDTGQLKLAIPVIVTGTSRAHADDDRESIGAA